MKKIKSIIIVSICMMFLLTISVGATTFNTVLHYDYSGNWRKGFTAQLVEYGGSPTTYKRMTGSYNFIDMDSGKTSGYSSFDTGLKQGQLTVTRTASTGWSMNRVSVAYYAGPMIDAKTLPGD